MFFFIFRIIGTPLESDWPENVSILWNTFTPRLRIPLKKILPRLTDSSEDLLAGMLKFDPNSRINASDALNHTFFTEEPLHS